MKIEVSSYKEICFLCFEKWAKDVNDSKNDRIFSTEIDFLTLHLWSFIVAFATGSCAV